MGVFSQPIIRIVEFETGVINIMKIRTFRNPQSALQRAESGIQTIKELTIFAICNTHCGKQKVKDKTEKM